MFVQCNLSQLTDECASMQIKGWLFCWLSKHNCGVESAQGLVASLQNLPIYGIIRDSDNVFFSLLYTAGDRKTAIVLGCDPRSSEGLTIFNSVLQWAKPNGLSLEIAPNTTVNDANTQRLLTGLNLSISPALLFIIYDSAPLNKDAFVQSVVKTLHISIDPDTPVKAHQRNDAQVLETVLPFVIGLATKYFKEQSLYLEANRTVYERFKVVSPVEIIQGHAFAVFARL